MLGLEEAWLVGRKREFHEEKGRGDTRDNDDIFPTPRGDEMRMPAISGVNQPPSTPTHLCSEARTQLRVGGRDIAW